MSQVKPEEFIGNLDTPASYIPAPEETISVTVEYKQIVRGQTEQVKETNCFIIKETSAPDAYDGFGTITLYRAPKTRIVGILNENYDWQATRYASGLEPVARIIDDIRIDEFSKRIWDRIRKEPKDGK